MISASELSHMQHQANWLFLLALLLASASCKRGNERGSSIVDESNAAMPDRAIGDSGSFLIGDINSEAPYARFVLDAEDGNHDLEWGTNNWSRRRSLDSLVHGQGYRLPPTVLWSNKDFICIMTNHSGAQSQLLFLPLNGNLETRFYEKDVEYSDSVDNFVCFIEDIDLGRDKVVWTIESLYSREAQTLETSLCNATGGYPWHTGVRRAGDSLIIETPCEDYGRRSTSIRSLVGAHQ